MAPSIFNESILPKQATSTEGVASTRANVEAAPQMNPTLPQPTEQAGAPGAHIDAAVVLAPAERMMGHTVGAARILPAEGATGTSPSLTPPSESRAVDAIVANIGASAGQPMTAAASIPQTSAAAGRDVYRVDAPAADRATKYIVSNISDRSTDSMVAAPNKTVTPAATAGATSRDTSAGPSAARNGAPAAAPTAYQDVSDPNPAYVNRAAGQGPSKALSTSYAEGMEMLSAQTMLLRTDGMLSELQSLVDAYAELHEDIDLQATLPGRQLDAKTILLLAQQAKHTDLGKLHEGSAVFVLNTLPQTIIEDNPATRRFSIFNMAGELVGQFDHADAHTFGLDLGGGRAGALGPGGFSTSFHLLGAHSRPIISALGAGKTPAGGINSRAKIDRKITRITSTGSAFNDAGDCASSCFVNQPTDGDGGSDSHRQSGRCVLCRHQQQ